MLQKPTDESPVLPPKAQLNAGLYTGQPFAHGAPWAAVPVVPDAGYMMSVTLLTAKPAPGGEHHYPGGGLRPGNNTPMLPRDVLQHGRARSINTVCMPDAPPVAPPYLPSEHLPCSDAMSKAARGAKQQQFRAFHYL